MRLKTLITRKEPSLVSKVQFAFFFESRGIPPNPLLPCRRPSQGRRCRRLPCRRLKTCLKCNSHFFFKSRGIPPNPLLPCRLPSQGRRCRWLPCRRLKMCLKCNLHFFNQSTLLLECNDATALFIFRYTQSNVFHKLVNTVHEARPFAISSKILQF